MSDVTFCPLLRKCSHLFWNDFHVELDGHLEHFVWVYVTAVYAYLTLPSTPSRGLRDGIRRDLPAGGMSILLQVMTVKAACTIITMADRGLVCSELQQRPDNPHIDKI